MNTILLYRKISWVLFVAVSSVFVLAGCSGRNQRPDLDTTSSGTIHISVDESFKPVIDSQIQVFEAFTQKQRSLLIINRKQNVLRI